MWYKSKWLLLNIIAVALAIIGYFFSNNMFTSALPWFGLAVVILNMIAGMIQGNTVSGLKKTVIEYKNKMIMNQPK